MMRLGGHILLIILSLLISLAPSCPEKTPEHYCELGQRMSASGAYDDAVRYYTAAILKKPGYKEALTGRAAAWEQLDSLTRAIADYRTLVDMERESVEQKSLFVLLLANTYYLNLQDSLACVNWKLACELNHNKACDLYRNKCR